MTSLGRIWNKVKRNDAENAEYGIEKNGADDLSLSLSLSLFGLPYLLSHSQPQMHLCGITGYATLAVMTRKEEEAGEQEGANSQRTKHNRYIYHSIGFDPPH